MYMIYFIDHLKENIHRRQYAGDACEFLQTPFEKREFTDSHVYVKELEEQKLYKTCPHCQSVKMLVRQVIGSG